MDTTEQYIKMCEKAEEIQESFKTTEPINYACLGSGHFVAHWYEEEPEHKHIAVLGDRIEIDRCNWCLFIPGEGSGSHTPEKYNKLNELFVWLPRQDQLQEMVKDAQEVQNDVCSLVDLFNDWLTGETDYVYGKNLNESMEQLWFAFIMAEKYQKHWNEEEWVK